MNVIIILCTGNLAFKELCANIQNYFLGSQIIGCVFMKKTLITAEIPPKTGMCFSANFRLFVYVAHYHGNKGFVIIRFCTNRVLCRMMVVGYMTIFAAHFNKNNHQLNL